MAFDLQDLLNRGIDAYAETQVARYSANDPTPNSRGANETTAPAGQPAFDGQSSTAVMIDSRTVLLLAVVAGLAYWLAKS
jgi:hypothetical protein